MCHDDTSHMQYVALTLLVYYSFSGQGVKVKVNLTVSVIASGRWVGDKDNRPKSRQRDQRLTKGHPFTDAHSEVRGIITSISLTASLQI